MKGGKYAKILSKIQDSEIVHMGDIRGNRFIELCMEKPCCCPSGLAPTWQPETQRNSCHKVSLRTREFISQGTQTLSNTCFNTMTVQVAKPTKISQFILNLHDSSLGWHVNAASRKSLEIQLHCITERF